MDAELEVLRALFRNVQALVEWGEEVNRRLTALEVETARLREVAWALADTTPHSVKVDGGTGSHPTGSCGRAEP